MREQFGLRDNASYYKQGAIDIEDGYSLYIPEAQRQKHNDSRSTHEG